MNFRNLLLILPIILLIGCSKEDEAFGVIDDDFCLVEINGVFEDVELDVAPIYIDGGNDGFGYKFASALLYPPEAREMGIEGVCVLQFVINEEGAVEAYEIIENPGGQIGETAVESLKEVTMGISFNPGILNDVPVKVKKQIKVKYRLE